MKKLVCKTIGCKWQVYSTAIGTPCIMLRCLRCGKHGYVKDFSEHEWRKAFFAPSYPYRWLEDERVIERL